MNIYQLLVMIAGLFNYDANNYTGKKKYWNLTFYGRFSLYFELRRIDF